MVEGILKCHRDGYGFVLSEDPERPDVFIPLRRMGGAMDGDTVRASIWPASSGPRLEGGVEEILRRGKHWLVGVLQKENKKFCVLVEKVKPPLKFEVDREELIGAKLGDTVGIEILEYPEDGRPGVGRVIQFFGARGDEKTEVDIVILKHQLPREFPEAVRSEAEQIARNPQIQLAEGRRDLRALGFVTIDGETAKDFDDAVCVKREGRQFRLWVSIADVSHYVRQGSALDREAFSRGTSVYLPDKVIPMLPEELSNDVCSLRPQEDRLSFTAELLYDEHGNLKESFFYKSLICSHARLTYREVARAILEKNEHVRKKITKTLPMLEQAFALFQLLREKRLVRGSIDFDLPEPEIIVNLEEGDTERIVKAERSEAHMLIEEFMVAANEAVATFITRQKRPSLYRVHGTPDPEKIRTFQSLLHNLGFQVHIPENPKPKDLAKVLTKTKGHAEQRLIQHILLRSMKQAIYSPKNEGHFGLASECYSHFTSPIRRYPDLVLHRILQQCLVGQKMAEGSHKAEFARLSPIASHTSRRERVAMEAEWEAMDLKVALFMQKFLGETFSGVVARVKKFGFFVELKEYFVEGLVLLEEIKDDYFIFEEKLHRLRGRRTKRIFKIGTELKVQVAKVDIEERRVYFTVQI
jgi:ribonuclease R